MKETGAHSSEQGDRESVRPSRNIWPFVCLTLVIGLLLIGFIFYLANQSTDQPSSMPGDISQASTSSSAEQNIRAAVEADAAALTSKYFPAESISATRASETKVEISISNVAYDTLSQAEQSAQQLSSALIEDLGISNSVVYLKDSVDNILITVVDGKTTYNAYEKPELENSQEYDPIVWVTDNGSRYHSSSTCSGMKDPSALTLSQAQELGYTACSKCN